MVPAFDAATAPSQSSSSLNQRQVTGDTDSIDYTNIYEDKSSALCPFVDNPMLFRTGTSSTIEDMLKHKLLQMGLRKGEDRRDGSLFGLIDALTEEVGQLIESLQQSLSEKESEIVTLETQLEEQRHTVDTEIRQLKHLCLSKDLEISSIQQNMEVVSTSNEALIVRVDSLQTMLASKELVIKDTARELQLLLSRVNDADRLVTEKDTVMVDLTKQSQSLLSSAATQAAIAMESQRAFHVQLESTKQQHTSLTSHMTMLAAAVTERNEQNVDLTTQIDALIASCTVQEQRSEQLTQEMSQAKTVIHQRDETIVSLFCEVASLEGDLDRHEEQHTLWSDQVNALKQSLSLQEQTTDSIAATEIGLLRGSVHECDQQNASLRSEIIRLTAMIAAQTEQHNASSSAMSMLEHDNDCRARENSSLLADVTRFRNDHEACVVQQDDLVGNVASLRLELSERDERVAALAAEVRALSIAADPNQQQHAMLLTERAALSTVAEQREQLLADLTDTLCDADAAAERLTSEVKNQQDLCMKKETIVVNLEQSLKLSEARGKQIARLMQAAVHDKEVQAEVAMRRRVQVTHGSSSSSPPSSTSSSAAAALSSSSSSPHHRPLETTLSDLSPVNTNTNAPSSVVMLEGKAPHLHQQQYHYQQQQQQYQQQQQQQQQQYLQRQQQQQLQSKPTPPLASPLTGDPQRLLQFEEDASPCTVAVAEASPCTVAVADASPCTVADADVSHGSNPLSTSPHPDLRRIPPLPLVLSSFPSTVLGHEQRGVSSPGHRGVSSPDYKGVTGTNRPPVTPVASPASSASSPCHVSARSTMQQQAVKNGGTTRQQVVLRPTTHHRNAHTAHSTTRGVGNVTYHFSRLRHVVKEKKLEENQEGVGVEEVREMGAEEDQEVVREKEGCCPSAGVSETPTAASPSALILATETAVAPAVAVVPVPALAATLAVAPVSAPVPVLDLKTLVTSHGSSLSSSSSSSSTSADDVARKATDVMVGKDGVSNGSSGQDEDTGGSSGDVDVGGDGGNVNEGGSSKKGNRGGMVQQQQQHHQQQRVQSHGLNNDGDDHIPDHLHDDRNNHINDRNRNNDHDCDRVIIIALDPSFTSPERIVAAATTTTSSIISTTPALTPPPPPITTALPPLPPSTTIAATPLPTTTTTTTTAVVTNTAGGDSSFAVTNGNPSSLSQHYIVGADADRTTPTSTTPIKTVTASSDASQLPTMRPAGL